MQPYLRERPLSMDGRCRNSECRADLRYGKAAKEAQLDDLALARIEFFQFTQRLIYARQIDVPGFVEFGREFQAVFAAAFLSRASDGVIGQGLAHGTREDAEEMGAIFPGGIRLV